MSARVSKEVALKNPASEGCALQGWRTPLLGCQQPGVQGVTRIQGKGYLGLRDRATPVLSGTQNRNILAQMPQSTPWVGPTRDHTLLAQACFHQQRCPTASLLRLQQHGLLRVTTNPDESCANMLQTSSCWRTTKKNGSSQSRSR
jgi:hypothetical protein